jgi:hypothetical protein
MTQKRVNVLGMELVQWNHESCRAHFAVEEDWATLYDIRSSEPGQGHATELLREAKRFYEAEGRRFGGTVALTDRMKRIYQRLGITEYAGED